MSEECQQWLRAVKVCALPHRAALVPSDWLLHTNCLDGCIETESRKLCARRWPSVSLPLLCREGKTFQEADGAGRNSGGGLLDWLSSYLYLKCVNPEKRQVADHPAAPCLRHHWASKRSDWALCTLASHKVLSERLCFHFTWFLFIYLFFQQLS